MNTLKLNTPEMIKAKEEVMALMAEPVKVYFNQLTEASQLTILGANTTAEMKLAFVNQKFNGYQDKLVINKEKTWLARNGKTALSNSSVTVTQLKLTVNSKRVSLDVSQPKESEQDRFAMAYGEIGTMEYRSRGGVRTKDNVNKLIITVQYKKKGFAKIFEEGFFALISPEKNDIIYRSESGIMMSWNDKSPATKEDLTSEYLNHFMPIFYTAGDQKRLSVKAIRTNVASSPDELDNIVNELTSGQLNYYTGSFMTKIEYARTHSRMSTVTSPSTLLKVDYKPTFAFLIKKTVDGRDGQMMTRAKLMRDAWSNFTGHDFREEAMYGMLYQTRPNASIKAASFTVSDDTMDAIIKSEASRFIKVTYSQLEKCEKTLSDVMDVLAGKETEGYEKGAALFLVNDLKDATPDYYCDSNTVKATFDPRMDLRVTILKMQSVSNLETSISGQALSSAYALNPEATTNFVAGRWVKSFYDKIMEIGKGSAKVLPMSMVDSEQIHHNTLASVGLPILALRSKSVYMQTVTDLFRGLQNQMNKNRIDVIDGTYSIALKDVGHYFGVSLLEGDEFFMPDFERYARQQRKHAQELTNKGEVDEAKKISEVLERGEAAIYRSPKMSIGEVIVRKSVSLSELKIRIRKLNLTKEVKVALLEMVGSIGCETIMIKGGQDSCDFHSGQDWDIDAFTCIFDTDFIELVRDAEKTALRVDFDSTKAVKITSAQIEEEIASLLTLSK